MALAVRLRGVPSETEVGAAVMLTTGLTVVTAIDDVLAVPTALSASLTVQVAIYVPGWPGVKFNAAVLRIVPSAGV